MTDVKLTLAGRIFHLSWLPFGVYRLLFFRSNIYWRCKFGSLDFMHHSPIDSSFTWLRLYLKFGNWWAYPVVIVSGYQPNCGIKIAIFHKVLFDNTKWAKVQLWMREGHPEWALDVDKDRIK